MLLRCLMRKEIANLKAECPEPQRVFQILGKAPIFQNEFSHPILGHIPGKSAIPAFLGGYQVGKVFGNVFDLYISILPS